MEIVLGKCFGLVRTLFVFAILIAEIGCSDSEEPISADAGEIADTIGTDVAMDVSVVDLLPPDTVPPCPPDCWEIPEDRLTTWDPGYRGSIPTVPVQVNAKTMGAKADGTTDDSTAVQEAINAVTPPGAVLLPAGTYLFQSDLVLKEGVVLRGEGMDKTHLIFDFPATSFNGAISVRGTPSGAIIAIEAGAQAGSTVLTVADASGLTAGDTIRIFSENDAETMYTKPEWEVQWAANAVGQFVEITAVNGKSVTLDVPLRLTHPQSRNPRLLKFSMVRDFGVEQLHIKRLDQSDDYLISVSGGINGWIRDCHLEYCTRGHIYIGLSRHITVSGNTMHHYNDNVIDALGFGVQIMGATSDCLIENNIFHSLRNSMTIGLGSNGNVFAYNYSRDRLSWPDIAISGHFPHMNLFEGNVVEHAAVANYWGPVGPLTTLYRNRITEGYIVINDHSQMINVIGNTIADARGVLDDGTIVDALAEYNLVAGVMQASSDKEPLLPPSLWRDSKPDYWGDLPWPCTGADVETATTPCQIPAQERDDGL